MPGPGGEPTAERSLQAEVGELGAEAVGSGVGPMGVWLLCGDGTMSSWRCSLLALFSLLGCN